MRVATTRGPLSSAALLLAGCAAVPPPATDWESFSLPGKRPTAYALAMKDGRAAVAADADRSASLWRRKLRLEPQELRSVEFSWWVGSVIEEAAVEHAETDDAPARLVLAFEGDTSRLSARNQAMFELARLAMGEPPPYATLMYVWDSKAAPDTVVVNRRSDRVRKIVVESGTRHVRRWRHYRRDIRADYRRAFGEEPGALVGVAFMTDTDNTQSRAQAWYGDVRFR